MILPLALLAVFSLACSQSCSSSAVTLTAEKHPRYLYSPNHPKFYSRQYSCVWRIEANSSFTDVVIQMDVVNSSMEPTSGCWKDSVEVIDGPMPFMRSLDSWCGNSRPTSTITSTRSSVLVVFTSNYDNNDYSGFFISYWLAKKPVIRVFPSELTALNYVLMGVSGVVILTLFGGLFIIISVQYVMRRRNKRAAEDKVW